MNAKQTPYDVLNTLTYEQLDMLLTLTTEELHALMTAIVWGRVAERLWANK